MRFLRPDEPASFERAVLEAREEVERACKDGDAPSFPDLWKSFRTHFATAQHNKCGYCEVILSATTGALDHYRPKSAIDELPADRSEHGDEAGEPHRRREDTSNVVGRSLPRRCDSGYAWAAYTWDNYIFACDRCNSGWKRCLFPVAVARIGPPVRGASESPLLLNPYERENPADHLSFDHLGQVTARAGSARGQATIDTCGLWRRSLVAQRHEKAAAVHGWLVRLAGARFAAEEEEVYANLEALGAPDRPHAGMVRAIFEEETGHAWDTFFGPDF